MKENVDITILEQAGFDSYWFSADKKGYSGVAVLTKIKPDKVFLEMVLCKATPREGATS